MPPKPPKCLEARLHILYIEQAEDQRGANKKRLPGLHLGVPKLGPTRCIECDGVVDVWRGRLDNVQTSLRMCCAEGSLFRPSVAQFAVASPRAALRYDVPCLGKWMTGQGTKRVTEKLVVGSALKVVAGELASEECGIEHAAFKSSDEDSNEGMWLWMLKWVASVRSRARTAGGRVVAVTLDKAAPMLVPSAAAGTIASHIGEPSNISDIIVVIGGPAGVPPSWQQRLDATLGEPLLKVALRGSLQHSYAALLDLILLHERNELVPALLDRLVLSPAELTQWMQAEQEIIRSWLGCIGCVRRRSSRSGFLGSPLLTPMRDPRSAAAAPTLEALLARHHSLMHLMTSGGAPRRARIVENPAASQTSSRKARRKAVTAAASQPNRPSMPPLDLGDAALPRNTTRRNSVAAESSHRRLGDGSAGPASVSVPIAPKGKRGKKRKRNCGLGG